MIEYRLYMASLILAVGNGLSEPTISEVLPVSWGRRLSNQTVAAGNRGSWSHLMIADFPMSVNQ